MSNVFLKLQHVSKLLVTNSYRKVHPDAYQLALYQSLGQANRGIDESAAYNGFELGNTIIPGCLTSDMCNARIHLCVPPCPIACESSTVYIKPFLGREEDGFEVPDMGEGGGSGDVYVRQELVLPPNLSFSDLMDRFTARMETFDEEDKATVRSRLLEDFYAHGSRLSISKYGISFEDNLPLDAFLGILARQVLAYDETMYKDDAKSVLGNPRRKVIVSSFSISLLAARLPLLTVSLSGFPTLGTPRILSCVI